MKYHFKKFFYFSSNLFNMNKFFSQSKDLLKKYRYLLISHHPSCSQFQDHTLNFSKIRLCIGCFIGYPSAILSILLGILFIYPAISQKIYILLFGIFLFLFQFLSLTKLTAIKPIKIIQKFLIGFGAGQILVVSYYWFPGSVLLKLLGVWGVILILMGPIGLLHYRNLRDTCENCPDRGNSLDCIYSNTKKSGENGDKIE